MDCVRTKMKEFIVSYAEGKKPERPISGIEQERLASLQMVVDSKGFS